MVFLLTFTILLGNLRWCWAQLNSNIDINEEFDLTTIMKSEKTLYFDIGIYVSYEALLAVKQMQLDPDVILPLIMKEVAKIFSWHNITFSVKHKEYWQTGNRVSIPTPRELYTLKTFFEKEPKLYDSHLIFHVFKDGDANVGYNYENTLCTPDAVGLISIITFTYDRIKAAQVIAHELGHALGFKHSDYMTRCSCLIKDRKHCVMYSKTSDWNESVPRAFDNCHMNRLFQRLTSFPCLTESLEEKRIYSSCGDGVVDVDEECDCGFKEMCKQKNSKEKYCMIDECQFAKYQCQCVTGVCCKKCKFARGQICRHSYGECDPEETCDGAQAECPQDIVVNNSELCDNGQGFCFNGMCTNLNSLCKYVYRNDRVFFSSVCTRKVKRAINDRCGDDHSYAGDHLLCSNQNLCRHFVCASSSSSLPHTMGIRHGNIHCVIPKIEIRMGVLQRAANYMECDQNAFCFEGHCTKNYSLLKICKDKNCLSLDNKKQILMDKFVNLPENKFGYRMELYEYYETPMKHQTISTVNEFITTTQPFNYTIVWILCASIIPLIFIMTIILVWKMWKPRKNNEV